MRARHLVDARALGRQVKDASATPYCAFRDRLPRGQADAAERLGVSAEWVRQIEERALSRLREAVDAEG
jgi:hypothetical protein